MRARNGLVMAMCLLLASVAVAQQKKLEVGSAAPGLDIEHWINGSATTIETGKVYVVEFWATWCGPCRRAIPHLNDLHRRFSSRGLTIIGVSDEEFGTVDRFVKREGDRMSYLVGVDRNKNTKRAWFEAAQQKGIPCSFIVDRAGKIAFIGHPMDDEFERVLRLVLSGRYDPKKEAAARPVLEAAERAVRVRNWRQAHRHFDEVIESDPSIFVNVARRKYEVLLVDEATPDEASAYGRDLLRKYADDAEALRDLSRDIVRNPRYTKRDLDLALAYADASLRKAGNKSPEALAAVALVRFHRGEVEKAIETQLEAWMLASEDEKADYRRVLDNYRESSRQASRSATN
jgi:thiol-disulfide isomerase/thioredoxin